jgi:Xaa-Pro aminopeptidase
MANVTSWRGAGYEVDDARLVRDRRSRTITMLRDNDLDSLILGRPNNVTYVSGATRLWSAGARSFVPSCVVLVDTNDIYLMATSDHGVPIEIPRDHLYSTTWNPQLLIKSLEAIPGLADCRSVAIDAMSPLFLGLLSEAFPKMSFVDVSEQLSRTRMIKSADELARIKQAVEVSAAALEAVHEGLVPGSVVGQLRGRFSRRMTSFGVTIPALECTISDGRRSLAPSAKLAVGDLVTVAGSVMFGGYEGPQTRTWECRASGAAVSPQYDQLAQAWRHAWTVISAALQPGTRAEGLAQAALRCDAELTAHAVGVGFERRVCDTSFGLGVDSGFELQTSMSLAIEVQVKGQGGARYVHSALVVITPDGHLRLDDEQHIS